MNLRTVWTAEDDDWESPWLLTAWDEYSVDGNHEGFCEELEKLRKQNDGRIRVVIVRVDDTALEKCFSVPTIDGAALAAIAKAEV